MKNSVLNFILFTIVSLTTNNLTAQNLVTLPAGTIVSVATNETIDADEVQIGNAIDFFVRSNVTVNGQVVIATGAIAEGWVKKVITSCEGKCSKITITVENVQTVDGQRIYLRSIPHTVKVDCCGWGAEAAKINLGTNLSARILNDVQINP